MKTSLKQITAFAIIAALFFSSTALTTVHASSLRQEEDPNPFCVDAGRTHPVAEAIADTYGTTYDQVMEWFCDIKDGTEGGEDAAGENQAHGLGQVMLALQTAEKAGDQGEAQHFLAQRREGKGWGQIWQEAGLIGKDRSKENGKPDHAGPPEDPGKPDHAGPKEKDKNK